MRALSVLSGPQSAAQVGIEVRTASAETKTPASGNALTGENRCLSAGAGEGIRTLDVNLGNTA